METKKIPKSQSSLEKEELSGGMNISEFRLYYKATVVKTVWFWHKNRNTDQWNKKESPEIIHAPTGTLFLTKEARLYSGGEDSLCNKWSWKNWMATCERMKLEHLLTPYIKINSKCKT